MAKQNRPEQQTQKAVVNYLRILENLGKLTFFHVPNGGARSKVEAGTRYPELKGTARREPDGPRSTPPETAKKRKD